MPNLRAIVLVLIIAAAAFAAACGFQPDVALRVGAAAAPAAIQSLVPGVISQATADVIKRDVDQGAKAASAAINCRKAIPQGISPVERRIAKARCYKALAVELRDILDRGNLGGHPILDSLFAFFDATATALEEYCRAVECSGGPGAESALASEDSEKPEAKDLENLDKELEQKLKDAAEKLKKQLKEHQRKQ